MLQRKTMTVKKLAENHFMIPDEVIEYARKYQREFSVFTVDGEPSIEVFTGMRLLAAAKQDGLKRHPELYGYKLSEDGECYMYVGLDK
jgi:hypothetical protein